jgi:hypothetical protein
MKKFILIFCLLILNNQVYSNSSIETEMDKIYETISASFNHDYSKDKRDALGRTKPIMVSIEPYKLKYCKDRETNFTFTVISKHSCKYPMVDGNRIKVQIGKKISKNEFDNLNPNFLENNNLICIGQIDHNFTGYVPFPYLVFFMTHSLDDGIFLNSVIPARLTKDLYSDVSVYDSKLKGIWMHQGSIKNKKATFMRFYEKNSKLVETNNIEKTSSLSLNISYQSNDYGGREVVNQSKCYANNEYWIAMHPDLVKEDIKVVEEKEATTKEFHSISTEDNDYFLCSEVNGTKLTVKKNSCDNNYEVEDIRNLYCVDQFEMNRGQRSEVKKYALGIQKYRGPYGMSYRACPNLITLKSKLNYEKCINKFSSYSRQGCIEQNVDIIGTIYVESLLGLYEIVGDDDTLDALVIDSTEEQKIKSLKPISKPEF